jgi:hypothetical protein
MMAFPLRFKFIMLMPLIHLSKRISIVLFERWLRGNSMR